MINEPRTGPSIETDQVKSDESETREAAPSRRKVPAKPAKVAAHADIAELTGPVCPVPAEPVALPPSGGRGNDTGKSGEEGDGRRKGDKKKKKKEKKGKRNKSATIIRFDDGLLPRIDAHAEALGLSRAAWVRMIVAQALSAS